MSARLPVRIFLGWTLVVWIGRIRNIVADDGLSIAGTLWRIAAAAVFVVLVVGVIVSRRRGNRNHAALIVLVAWTIAWWLVRGVGIILDDHDLGFTVVHTFLMIVSMALAMWAWSRRDG